MNELENLKEQIQEALFALNAIRLWDCEDEDEESGGVISIFARTTLDKIAEIQKKLKP